MNKPKATPHRLKLVDYDHPILRQKTEPIKFPLSQEDQQIIADMKYSIRGDQLKAADAPWESAAGMAANQWGINKQIFLYCPGGDVEEQLEVIINPSYEPIEASTKNLEHSMDETWEACFSVPLSTGNIKRYTRIRVHYQNEMGETLERELEGWPARVWQHENDHLNGYLYDDPRTGKCLGKRTFPNLKAVDAFYDEIRRERRKNLEDHL